MADELNTPNHRYYQNRYNVELAPNEMSKQWILARGIARIDNAVVLPLFALAEPGVWYDPSDLTTLFQDDAGTTPVTAPTQQVGKILDKSGRGNHATQATSTQRPIYGINPITGTRNLLTYSEQFDNAIWAKTNTTIDANVIAAPNGTTTADKLQETGVTAGFFSVGANPQNFLFSASYTWSCYAKAAERSFIGINFSAIGITANFDLTTGASQVNTGTATLTNTDVGNGWRRCTATFTTPASGVNLLYHIVGTCLSLTTGVTVGVAGYGAYLWGAQVEQQPAATAYQKVVSQYEVTEVGIQSAGYLAFDGVDDGMVTGTITPGIDKAQVFAGTIQLNNVGTDHILVELSANAQINNGGLQLFNPAGSRVSKPGLSGSSNYVLNYPSAASTLVSATTNTPRVFAAQYDTAQTTSVTEATLRMNGAALTLISEGAADSGTGNFGNYPLYIGRRGGTTLPYNGRIYSLITRFGANLTTGQITSTESWVNSKTGAY